MELSTLPLTDGLSSPETLTSESQVPSLSTLVVGLGVCLSLPLVVYMAYVVYQHRRRCDYIDLDKTLGSVKTASPRASESHDVDEYFSSSTDSDQGAKSSGDSEGPHPATFYIGADSEEEMTSNHFIKKSYLPARVHLKPLRKARPPLYCPLTI